MSKLYCLDKNVFIMFWFSFAFRSEITERLKGNYTLNIKFESDARKNNFNLKYNGTKTILDIKTDLYTLTNVPVRHQVWSGWPPNIDDQTMIALSGIR